MEQTNRNKAGSRSLKILAVLLCAALTLALLLGMGSFMGTPGRAANTKAADVGIMDKFDMFMTNAISDALDGVLSVDKVYWLSDDDLGAPEPNPDCYGETDDPARLQRLLEDAAELLDGQDTLFTPQAPLLDGSTVTYYLDETILVVTWKQVVDTAVYTFSEVKIAHPSQFRRFLAGGGYGSGILYTTTEMAASVNAVTASSGDYHSFRNFGIVVYDGQVYRTDSKYLDTCFIDENGDLHLTRQGEVPDLETTQAYVEENNIRFSLAFGPALVEDGQVCAPEYYPIGMISERYSRAALCQWDTLHYVLVTVNMEPPYVRNPDIETFATRLSEMGVRTAYALDGGQTAVIVTGDKMMNSVDYGFQREISDIIYFATAIPEGK